MDEDELNDVISRGRDLARHLREIYAGQEGWDLDDEDNEEDLVEDPDVEHDEEETAQLEAVLAQAENLTEQLRRIRQAQDSAEGSRTPRQRSTSRDEGC